MKKTSIFVLMALMLLLSSCNGKPKPTSNTTASQILNTKTSVLTTEVMTTTEPTTITPTTQTNPPTIKTKPLTTESKKLPVSLLYVTIDKTGEKIKLGMTKKQVEKIFPPPKDTEYVNDEWGTRDIDYGGLYLKYIKNELVCIISGEDKKGLKNITFGSGLKLPCSYKDFEKVYGDGIKYYKGKDIYSKSGELLGYKYDDHYDENVMHAIYVFRVVNNSELVLEDPNYGIKYQEKPERLKNVYAVTFSGRYEFAIGNLGKYNY